MLGPSVLDWSHRSEELPEANPLEREIERLHRRLRLAWLVIAALSIAVIALLLVR
jgi:hypothetical protein